ncbi:zinc-ribbon and DUF3426 domain-containing protein [Methylomonas koyamae]|nr:zinc-ribbon and DUF3426 domain-containing protein [Methylomonas koyamae]
MFSRCPHCDARQTVTVGQLRRQRGLLACRACGQRFDGLASLSEDGSLVSDCPSESDVGIAKQDWPSSRFWGWASAMAFAVLVGQVFYFEGEELYRSPSVAKNWQRLCMPVGCQPPSYQNAHELSVSHADLTRQADSSYVFSAAITNHAAFPQAETVLRLTLLGFNGQAIAERVFSLPQLAGIAVLQPDQTLPIRLHIAAPAAQVGGYVFQLS